jgi:hypothetical protein
MGGNAIKKIFKIMVVNVFITVCIIVSMNAGGIFLFQGYNAAKGLFKNDGKNIQTDHRAFLPNYKNNHILWAEEHFSEFKNLRGEYMSYVEWRRLPYRGKTITIDENGIRVTPQAAVSADAPLAVFLGGSTMWGTGSDDKNTIPALFARKTRGRYNVLNYGESGYRAFQSLVFLQMRMAEGVYPSLVVSYDGVNEYSSSYAEHKSSLSSFREVQIRERMRDADSLPPELSLRHYLGNMVTPLRELTGKITGKIPVRPQVSVHVEFTDDNAQKTALALLESWLAIKKTVESGGARFLAVLQPNAAVGNPRTDHLEKKSFDDIMIEKSCPGFYPMVIELMDTPRYSVLKDNFLDLSSAFDGRRYILIDGCHSSPNGNEIIADKILEYLSKSDRNSSN